MYSTWTDSSQWAASLSLG